MTSTEQEYRALPKISQSALKVFLKSPEEYFHQFVQGSASNSSTSSMNLGSLLHTLILEPQEFNNCYARYNENQRPSPAQNFAAKVNKEWRDALVAMAEAEGKLLVNEELQVTCGNMLEQLNNHKLAQEYLWRTPLDGVAYNELGILWQDAATGLELKSKLDRLIVNNVTETATVVDYKTTSCPDLLEFSWSVKKYGYDIQAAFYQDAARYWLAENGYAGFGVDVVFIPQKTSPPYQVLGVVALGEQKIAQARTRYQQGLEDLHRCLTTGVWKQDTQLHTLFPDTPVDNLWEMPL